MTIKVNILGQQSQGNLIQGEGSDSLKTALETREKTAQLYETLLFQSCRWHTPKLVKVPSLWSPNRFFKFLNARRSFPLYKIFLALLNQFYGYIFVSH